ncbi:MAG: hypothetical protein CL908_04690 [Deltaproteobacteria bacterium]|nr:hypothetical protein [Deltaproteobacteria bacterium]
MKTRICMVSIAFVMAIVGCSEDGGSSETAGEAFDQTVGSVEAGGENTLDAARDTAGQVRDRADDLAAEAGQVDDDTIAGAQETAEEARKRAAADAAESGGTALDDSIDSAAGNLDDATRGLSEGLAN